MHILNTKKRLLIWIKNPVIISLLILLVLNIINLKNKNFSNFIDHINHAAGVWAIAFSFLYFEKKIKEKGYENEFIRFLRNPILYTFILEIITGIIYVTHQKTGISEAIYKTYAIFRYSLYTIISYKYFNDKALEKAQKTSNPDENK